MGKRRATREEGGWGDSPMKKKACGSEAWEEADGGAQASVAWARQWGTTASRWSLGTTTDGVGKSSRTELSDDALARQEATWRRG
jgi:hypothetical protein